MTQAREIADTISLFPKTPEQWWFQIPVSWNPRFEHHIPKFPLPPGQAKSLETVPLWPHNLPLFHQIRCRQNSIFPPPTKPKPCKKVSLFRENFCLHNPEPPPPPLPQTPPPTPPFQTVRFKTKNSTCPKAPSPPKPPVPLPPVPAPTTVSLTTYSQKNKAPLTPQF